MDSGMALCLTRGGEIYPFIDISTSTTSLTLQGNGVELAARDWRIWAVSRVFTGMGNGLVQTQCVIYVAEVAPIAIRYAPVRTGIAPSSHFVRGTLLASYALLFQLGGLAGAVGLQILQTVSANDVVKASTH